MQSELQNVFSQKRRNEKKKLAPHSLRGVESLPAAFSITNASHYTGKNNTTLFYIINIYIKYKNKYYLGRKIF